MMPGAPTRYRLVRVEWLEKRAPMHTQAMNETGCRSEIKTYAVLFVT
jgi:hypothetical protein